MKSRPQRSLTGRGWSLSSEWWHGIDLSLDGRLTLFALAAKSFKTSSSLFMRFQLSKNHLPFARTCCSLC